MECELGLHLPMGEVTVKIELHGIGGFLAKHPPFFRTVKAVIEVAVGHIGERARAIGELQLTEDRPLVPFLQRRRVGLQIRVYLYM